MYTFVSTLLKLLVLTSLLNEIKNLKEANVNMVFLQSMQLTELVKFSSAIGHALVRCSAIGISWTCRRYVTSRRADPWSKSTKSCRERERELSLGTNKGKYLVSKGGADISKFCGRRTAAFAMEA